MSALRRHPLITFFVLAYAFSWWPLPFGGFLPLGPLVGALIVLTVTEGRAGLRELGSRMIRWRFGWIWYVVALGLPLAVHLLTVALNVALGAGAPSLTQFSPLSGIIVVFALRLVSPLDVPLGEEPGWRGFALPRLQADRSPLLATLILGVLVAGWHAPLLLPQYGLRPLDLLATVAVTFWYTWLFNRTGGSQRAHDHRGARHRRKHRAKRVLGRCHACDPSGLDLRWCVVRCGDRLGGLRLAVLACPCTCASDGAADIRG